jgi:hypothetical protein
MSFSAMTWARTVRFGSPIRKAIAYTLADHHNGDSGRCDPSVPTIAREADAGIRAVEINLRWMERAGAIAILRRPGCRNAYILNFAWGTAAARPIRSASRKQRTPAPDAGASAPTPAFDGVGAAPTPAPDADEPEREDNRKEEDARERARPAPLSDEIWGKEESRIEAERPAPPSGRRIEPGPDETPWPDEPEPELLAALADRGFTRDEGEQLIGDWARGKGATSADWPGVVRSWQPRCLGSPTLPRAHRRHAPPAKRDWRSEREAFLARMAAKYGVADDATIVGVAL